MADLGGPRNLIGHHLGGSRRLRQGVMPGPARCHHLAGLARLHRSGAYSRKVPWWPPVRRRGVETSVLQPSHSPDSPLRDFAPTIGLQGTYSQAVLCDELAALMVGKARDDLVFTDQRGGVLRNSNWRARVFRPAVATCQATDGTFPTITPHDLRHTAASLAVSAHANVKAVQRMLGHAKASMTLDIYADLFDEDLDGVADRLDLAIRSTADQLRTGVYQTR